jgi:hypothetical protein
MNFDLLILVSLALAVAVDCGLAAWAILQTRGLLRFLAAMPLAVLLTWGVYLVLEIRAHPTSHNLWPFELLLVAALGCVFSVGLLAVLNMRSTRPMQH